MNDDDDEAMEIYNEVLQQRRAVLGDDHPDTLATMNNVASILVNKGNFKTALEIYEQVLQQEKEVLGEDHPSTLTTMTNLGSVLSNQANYDAAMEIYKEVLQQQKAVLGEDHSSTLITMNNLASVHDSQGNDEAALEIHKEVLQHDKAGKNLALGQRKQELYKKVLQYRKRNPRGDAGCVWANEYQFLVVGGSGPNSSCVSLCEYYEKRINDWILLPINLPFDLRSMCVAMSGNRIFVVGGESFADDDHMVSRSDLISIDVPEGKLSKLAEQDWETLAPMKDKRSSFACAAHGNALYVFGGRGENGSTELVMAERYDIENDRWTPLPNMPGGYPVACAAGVVRNKIYVVGGCECADDGWKRTDACRVFDTSTQRWEPSSAKNKEGEKNDGENHTNPFAVPSMNTMRSNLSVAVVDHFLIAIGGVDEGGKKVSTIEVLDTERNLWRYARTVMRHSGASVVAGFSKKTNEITVVNTLNTAWVETIEFEAGLLSPSFCNKERGQKVINDTARGDDRLGVKTIAKVLAELLVFKDSTPPLVLGVLGMWGRGKSYFFNLMMEHMISIQKRPADLHVREAFAGHIYVVEFDAWTYSKGDVWSSLMIQILKSLNEQLQFEESVNNQDLIDGKVSTVEVFHNLSSRDIEYLKNNREVLKTLEHVKKNGDSASESLLRAINENYKKDLEELKRIRKEMQKKQAQMVVEKTKRCFGNRGKKAIDEAFHRAFQPGKKPEKKRRSIVPFWHGRDSESEDTRDGESTELLGNEQPNYDTAPRENGNSKDDQKSDSQEAEDILTIS